MSNEIDPNALIDRLLKPNEELAGKVDRLHKDNVEIKTLLEQLVEGRVLERLQTLEIKATFLIAGASTLFTLLLGLAVKVIWGG